MQIKNEIISLPEGSFNAELQFFEERDRVKLYSIYKNWRKLCSELNEIKARAVNLPEGLSEGAFALEMKSPRVSSIPGANSSFDCYNSSTKKRIQVKACSVLPDLTSFGPKSVWDELYFCDFYKEGKWDGTFDIYLIDNNLIYNHKVNANQTFIQQQKQGRRPRFSIYSDIIIKHKLKPIKIGDLSNVK
jgi:hypothetical protein